MLLLNSPKIANDAAKAAKRLSPELFQPLTTESLTEFLNFPEINVTSFYIETQDDQQYLHLSCEHKHDVGICPNCQQPCFSGYDNKKRGARHLDLFEMRAIIHFKQRRFDCLVCGKPFTEQLDWIDKQRRHSCAFEEYIYERVKKTPRKHVALQEGLSESTVLDIFKRKVKKIRRQLNHHGSVRALGVDEISVCKHYKQFALVLSDIERRCVIAVLPNRLKMTFEEWLDSLSKAERKAIKIVSMDMWEPYRQAVRKKLPHAQIVADRFHVMKNLNHQLEIVRRKLQREIDEESASILKGSRWILLKNRVDLNPIEEERLRKILEFCPELRAIYLLKENFRTICEKIKDKKRAERFLRAWKYKALDTGISYLLKFVKTLKSWWLEFLNYFDEQITQGFVEGTNRAIRGIINRAFGFRNFENLRLQILAEHGHY
jgi:transposase